MGGDKRCAAARLRPSSRTPVKVSPPTDRPASTRMRNHLNHERYTPQTLKTMHCSGNSSLAQARCHCNQHVRTAGGIVALTEGFTAFVTSPGRKGRAENKASC